MVRDEVGQLVEIAQEPTDDLRSYRICSDKIRQDIGFEPKHTISDAVRGLLDAFNANKIPNSMTDPRYFNIKTMQSIELH